MKREDPSTSLLVRYKFRVFFEVAPNIDIRFQKVSGISSKVETETFYEGGDNTTAYYLPNRVTYGNLVLEQGRAVSPPETMLQMHNMFSSFLFVPTTITVCSYLGAETETSVATWTFKSAYPVNWSITDLDADSNAVVIEKLELAYSNLC